MLGCHLIFIVKSPKAKPFQNNPFNSLSILSEIENIQSFQYYQTSNLSDKVKRSLSVCVCVCDCSLCAIIQCCPSSHCKRLLMLLFCVGLWPFLNSSIWWQASGFERESVCEGLLSPSLLSRTTEEHYKLSFHTANKRQSLHLAHTKPHTHKTGAGFAPHIRITLLLILGLIKLEDYTSFVRYFMYVFIFILLLM